MGKKLTTEQFIERARAVHGDKYDYSKVEYNGNRKKVTIICPKHGEFEQEPINHLHKHGCPYCAGSARGTTESFIEKARKVHGDKYDYSKTKYGKNNREKVIIICPIHGEFKQEPVNHLNGQGCPHCYGKHKKTTEQFIEAATAIHGDKYDYSQVEYVNNSTMVKIICRQHGVFWQTPYGHINGQGCPICTRENISKKQRLGYDLFVQKAMKIHGKKYKYPFFEYKNNKQYIDIICPKHGLFKQTIHEHLSGYGCIECSGNRKKTTKEFIKDAIDVHGDKYDYSKTEYINAVTKVRIICPEHGEFEQRPNDHLNGHGCPKCKSSKLEEAIRNFLIEKGIKFTEQKTFTWLGSLSLDFYLTDYNVGIECQGAQHFVPVEFFGGEEGLKSTMERDERKSKLCNDKGVELLYFTYYEGIKEEGNIYKNKDKLLEKIMSTKCL